MNSIIHPNLEPRSSERGHYTTPTKAKVQGVIEFMKAKKIDYTKQDVFDFFGVSRTRGYAMLKNKNTNRRHHHAQQVDRRGRRHKLSEKDVDRMEEIIQLWGIEARALGYKELAEAAEVPEVSEYTIRRELQARHYRKYIACTKTYVPDNLRQIRKNWARHKRNSWTLQD